MVVSALLCVSSARNVGHRAVGWVPTPCHSQERGHLEQVKWERWPDLANSTLTDPQHPLASEERGWLLLGPRAVAHTRGCWQNAQHGSPADAFNRCFVTERKPMHPHSTRIFRVLVSVLLLVWVPPHLWRFLHTSSPWTCSSSPLQSPHTSYTFKHLFKSFDNHQSTLTLGSPPIWPWLHRQFLLLLLLLAWRHRSSTLALSGMGLCSKPWQTIDFQPIEAWFWTFTFSFEALRGPKPHTEEKINF